MPEFARNRSAQPLCRRATLQTAARMRIPAAAQGLRGAERRLGCGTCFTVDDTSDKDGCDHSR